jgi:hypothetical protein
VTAALDRRLYAQRLAALHLCGESSLKAEPMRQVCFGSSHEARTIGYGWRVLSCLILILAFQLPGSLAQREDDYAFVRTLVDIHRLVDGQLRRAS